MPWATEKNLDTCYNSKTTISGTRSMHVVCNVARIQSVRKGKGRGAAYEQVSVRSADHASLACFPRTALGTINRSSLARCSSGVAIVVGVSDVISFVVEREAGRGVDNLFGHLCAVFLFISV